MMEKYFYGRWLVIGAFQIVFGIENSPLAFSSEEIHLSAVKYSISKRPVDTSVTSNYPGKQAPTLPVRYPRNMLKQSLSGSIEGSSLEGQIYFFAFSPISWIEYPTTLPPPGPGAIADFRDFQGCLNYQDLDGVALCFNVMPDVSSIGINSREMHSRGIENFITDRLNERPETAQCSFSVSQVRFRNAFRIEGQARLHYTAKLEPQRECEVGSQSLQFVIQFQNT